MQYMNDEKKQPQNVCNIPSMIKYVFKLHLTLRILDIVIATDITLDLEVSTQE